MVSNKKKLASYFDILKPVSSRSIKDILGDFGKKRARSPDSLEVLEQLITQSAKKEKKDNKRMKSEYVDSIISFF